MSDEQALKADVDEALRKAAIHDRLKLKDATITRMVRNRIYVKKPGETTEHPDSLCSNCGGSFIKRGHCTNCGAKR